ncbi:MAG: Uma2 family endonuclease [Verrucomicrobiota bacterium]|nr:Uma2 family endonuclease [Verrucomicrobiota bacterium]
MSTAVAVPKKARLPGAQRLMTSEEFLEWLQPGVFADLINGEIVMHSPVDLRHARLTNFLDRLLGAYIEQEDLGELHRESVAVRLSSRETFLPDLAYFTKAQAGRLLETHVPFAPTFVAEVLSPRTAKNDTGRKFTAYELHGVQEYWILDPQTREHRFYRRAGDLLEEYADGAARIEALSIPGFWVKREWLSSPTFPLVARCLAEILGPKREGARRKKS